jgi:hypothetical protein
MGKKLLILYLVIFFLIVPALFLFSQKQDDVVVIGGNSGEEQSLFLYLLRQEASPLYPEDPEIGALYRSEQDQSGFEEVVQELYRFFADTNRDSPLIDQEIRQAYERARRVAEEGEEKPRSIRELRVGRFSLFSAEEKASVRLRFFDEKGGSRVGTLFFRHYAKGWKIAAADFFLLDPFERSGYGQYAGENRTGVRSRENGGAAD